MSDKKKSKKKIILSILGVLVVVFGIVIAIGVHFLNQSEEVWAFRDTLDTVYFPIEKEIAACVYDDGDSKDYNCLVQELSNKIQEAKERITAYEVSSDDAKKLKNEVLNGIAVIEHISEHNVEVDPNDTTAIAKEISDLTNDMEDFYSNHEKISNILNEYYE